MNEDKLVTDFLKAIRPRIQEIIRQELNGYVFRYPAVVVDADNGIHYATVRVPLADNNENQNMWLMNCTGEALKTGDNVWIEYAYDMKNAVIAIKNDGKPWGW